MNINDDEIVLHPDTLNELDSSELALLEYIANIEMGEPT